MSRLLNKLRIWSILRRLWSRLDAWLDQSTLTVHFVAENSTPQSEDRLLARTLTDMRAILQQSDSALRARSAQLSLAREYLSISLSAKAERNTAGHIYQWRQQ